MPYLLLELYSTWVYVLKSFDMKFTFWHEICPFLIPLSIPHGWPKKIFKNFNTSQYDLTLEWVWWWNSRTFWDCRLKQTGSGGAVTAWKIFDFKLPICFNIAILTPKIVLKHHWKSFIAIMDHPKNHYWKLIYIEAKINPQVRSIIESI